MKVFYVVYGFHLNCMQKKCFKVAQQDYKCVKNDYKL